MPTFRKYPDGHWWLRCGRFTVGTQNHPPEITLSEREGWVRVWRFGRWSATRERRRNRTSIADQ